MSGAERREQILDATKEVVAEHGFHAVSIDRVSHSAGISRPVVYEHFGHLIRLLEALVERETRRALEQLDVLEALLEPATSEQDPRELLLGALGAYLEAVRADPVTWRLVLVPPEGAPPLLRERIAAGRPLVLARLAETAAPLLLGPDGAAPPDPELTARALSALADEGARSMLADPEAFSIERIVAYARWAVGQFGVR